MDILFSALNHNKEKNLTSGRKICMSVDVLQVKALRR
jgi:hypothetical protein